ncbi:MAG: hypothetical protein HC902_11135 [Calothrix sp. SM1_5_4]|nr:hypothetical protein [Calothrix sp. SM1_5_4]
MSAALTAKNGFDGTGNRHSDIFMHAPGHMDGKHRQHGKRDLGFLAFAAKVLLHDFTFCGATASVMLVFWAFFLGHRILLV